MLKNAVVFCTAFAFASAADDATQLEMERELLNAISLGASDEAIMGMLEADGLLESTLDDIDLIGAPPVGELVIDSHRDLNHGRKTELEWTQHGRPLFTIDDLVDLQVDFLKLKVDLAIKKDHFNPKDYKYTLKDLEKLKKALFNLQDIFKHNPTHLGGTRKRPLLGKIVLKELIELLEQVIELFKKKSAIKKILLEWEHGRPLFTINDLVDLQVDFLKLKVDLAIKKDHFNPKDYKYTLKDLEKLKKALFQLQDIFKHNPTHLGGTRHSPLLGKIVLKELIELLEQVIELFKGKSVIKKILLKFNKKLIIGKPEFGIHDLIQLQKLLAEFNRELLHPKFHTLNPKYFPYGLEQLKKLKIALLKVKIILVNQPKYFGSVLPADVKIFKFFDLVEEIIKNKIWKAKKISLLFGKHGKPQFGATKIFELEAVLLKFKEDLMHLNPKSYKENSKHFLYQLDDLNKLKVALLNLKIFILTNPHHFRTHLPVDKIIDLIGDLVQVVKKLLLVKQPIHPIHPVKPHFGNGKCSGEAKNIKFLRHIRKTVEKCSKKFNGDKHNTERCVQNETHLSRKCSSCFGDYAACVTKKCWFTCAFKSDDACHKCEDDECSKPLEKCAFGDWTHTWKSGFGFSWKVNGNRRRVNFLETLNFL